MSTEEENMALSRRLMEARVTGDLDAVDEMLTPDFVTHTKLVPGQQPGRKGEKWAITQLTAAFSNRSVVVEDQVAAGNKVVTRFVVHVTHDRGELMGVAPSGKVMTNKIIMIHRIEGGRIAEEWSIGTLGLKLRGQLLEQEIRERERVEQELRVARRIQQASLPKEVPTLEQLANRVAPCKDAEHGHLLEGTQAQGRRGGRTGNPEEGRRRDLLHLPYDAQTMA